MDVVVAWAIYEDNVKSYLERLKIKAAGRTYPAYPETKRLIAQLISFIRGRPYLKARLHQERAELLNLEDHEAGATQEYETALQLLKYLAPAPDISKKHLETALHLVNLHRILGNKKRAETLCWEVLRFKWATDLGHDGAFWNGFQRQAAEQLLELYRGNRKLLEALVTNDQFPKSAKLQDFITEAGGSKTFVVDYWRSKGYPDFTAILEAERSENNPTFVQGTDEGAK